jgi:transposase
MKSSTSLIALRDSSRRLTSRQGGARAPACGHRGAREDSSGERTRRGGITKTGNAHLRRIVIEAAWAYRHRPAVGTALRKRQATASVEVKAIAWKAQHRLHARYRALTARGKCKQHVVTAVGRELLGFIWAIGVHVASDTGGPKPIAA